MTILVPIASAAGVITVFTPCILPVLPVVLASGTTGSKRRPYAVAAGLVTTFTLFVLAGAWIWSLLGAALGIVFIPCGGPVLAAVTSNVGRHRVGAETVFVALFYALGAAIPIFLIARGSGRATGAFRAHAQTIRIAGGVLMAVAALVIYNGWAESWQTKVPGFLKPVQEAIEGNSAADHALSKLKGERKRSRFTEVQAQNLPPLAVSSRPVEVALNDYGRAPDFKKISAWINTPALDL